MDDRVRTIGELEALYGEPVEIAVRKVTDHVTVMHGRFIEASPFVVLATVGPDGVDCSPRGDPPGFVRVTSPRVLHLPDRRGNNRIDSLRNIVADGRVALLFFVPGINITLRVNGSASLRTDDALRTSFTFDDKVPATVIEISVDEVYTQCAKALVRSALWDPASLRSTDEVPTTGQIMEEITAGEIEAGPYDVASAARTIANLY